MPLVPTETGFTSVPNRDAYAAIRGFFYQAILSLKAWVELGPSELLELESGEDVDWVSLLNSSRAEDVNRTLGQIKYRRKRLTLKSPEALMSVFRYWQHVTHNPNLRLQFRFISNADYGTERGVKHPSGLCGIELWHSLSLALPDFRQSIQSFSEKQLLDFSKRLLMDAARHGCRGGTCQNKECD